MYGSLYSLFSVKIIYLSAIFIFEIGSLVTAVAPSSVAFIVGRAIAGVSAVLQGLILFNVRGRSVDEVLDRHCGLVLRLRRHPVVHE